jgi:hypothetical protein
MCSSLQTILQSFTHEEGSESRENFYLTYSIEQLHKENLTKCFNFLVQHLVVLQE